MADRESVKALTDLGFTNLEAEIYAFLLQESPVTGYRIAQALGKPAANTYKAIQTLETKGAVIVDDGSSRMCRAVSSDELLARLSREFETRRQSAQKSLVRIHSASPDERIYQIRSRDQVLQRGRDMLSESRQVALVMLSCPFVSDLAEELLQAGARGVDVAILTDQTLRIEGVEVLPEESGLRARPTLQVVVDAEQVLVAMFDDSGALLHAIWSRSPMLAVVHHEGLASEMCLANVEARLKDGDGAKRIGRAVASLRRSSTTSGFDRLKS